MEDLSRADRLCYDVVTYLEATRCINRAIEKHLPNANDALMKIESAIKNEKEFKREVANMFALFRLADMREAVNRLQQVSATEEVLRRQFAYTITGCTESSNDD